MEMTTSQLALGCMRLYQLSVSEADQRTMDGTEHGISLFDHADIYGGGESETRFGQVLRLHPDLRARIQIQSKCSVQKGCYNCSKEHIIEAVEGSLRRLQTDYLDSLLLHRPDELLVPDEVAEAIASLMESGKIRSFGVSNMSASKLALLNNSMPGIIRINQLQFGLGHSYMVDEGLYANTKGVQSINHTNALLDYCRLNAIQVQAWSPLRFGAGLNRKLVWRDEQFNKATTYLDDLARAKNVSSIAILLAWIARHPARIISILGSMNLNHLHDAYQSQGIVLSRPEWYMLYSTIRE